METRSEHGYLIGQRKQKGDGDGKDIRFVRVILEAVAFGVSLPITAPLGKVDAAREFLIEDPYSFVFQRPLGEM